MPTNGAADVTYMRMALAHAEELLAEDIMPVGAVVVRDDQVFVRGKEDGFATPYLNHAEMIALQKALPKWQTKREYPITAYTTLEPCLMCTAFMLHTRVARIVYALEDPYGGASGIVHSHDMPPRHKREQPTVIGGLLREESRLLLRRWFLATKNEYWRNAQGNPFYELCMK